jgi:alpha-tubulin suppressor-like RCC1 family protein
MAQPRGKSYYRAVKSPLRIRGCLTAAAVLFVSACSLDVAGPKAAPGGCPDGQPCSVEPVLVLGGHQFKSISAGKYHTCGLTENGEAWCWGLNSTGQLGAFTDNIGVGVPVRVGGGMPFKMITAGELHTCGIGMDDGAYCWGINQFGVLGVTEVTSTCGGSPCSPTPVRAVGTRTFVTLDAGASHTCGTETGGATVCWGANIWGELGSEMLGVGSTSGITVSSTRTFPRLSAGYRFSCALDAGAELLCWGTGEEGQLATTDISNCDSPSIGRFHCSATPVPANSQLRFSSISVGAAFGCGISTTATLHCWGYNGQGQLGTDDFVTNTKPVDVKTTGTWSSVTAGYFHACALRPTGAAFCWGINNSAQIGDTSSTYFARTPHGVAGGKNFIRITAGANHTCGLTAEGEAWCWGGDFVFQLGRG